MATKKPQPVSELSARSIMDLPKTGTPQTEWRDDKTHLGIKLIEFGLRAVGHRNLVVELSARLHPRVDRTIIEYGLFIVDPIYRQQERVYQLAIDDPKYVTHRQKGMPNIYGSHELIGDLTLALPQCNGHSFSQGLELFLLRINLELDEGPIDDPFALVLK